MRCDAERRIFSGHSFFLVDHHCEHKVRHWMKPLGSSDKGRRSLSTLGCFSFSFNDFLRHDTSHCHLHLDQEGSIILFATKSLPPFSFPFCLKVGHRAPYQHGGDAYKLNCSSKNVGPPYITSFVVHIDLA